MPRILDFLAAEWEAATPADRWLVILAWATLLGHPAGVAVMSTVATLRQRVKQIREADRGALALLYLEAIGRYSPADDEFDDDAREFLLDLVREDCYVQGVHCGDVGLLDVDPDLPAGLVEPLLSEREQADADARDRAERGYEEARDAS